MVCRSCRSQNVVVQAVNETTWRRQRRSIFWWILIGWWWLPLKWLIFTIPAMMLALCGRKKYRLHNRARSVAVCQNCGKHWYVK